MKKRTWLAGFLALVLAIAMALPSFADSAADAKKWAEDNGLNKDETMEELYEKAKEEGKLVIYTISSRTERVKNAFVEKYPGIDVEVYDISSGTLKEKFQTEYTSGIRTVDILHSKEQTGDYVLEFFKEGMLHTYKPASIFANSDAKYEGLAPLLLELNLWFYNSEKYEKTPLTSWWDLTKEEWKGKFVYQDAASNDAYLAPLVAMVQHADEMAAEYEKVFGTPIVLEADEPNAGYAFIKRFLANKPIIAKGSDEVVSLVGEAGQEDPPVGYSSSVKLRKVDDGLKLAYDPLNMGPTNGLPAVNFLSISNEAPHPNAAKLFIKFWMGGEDGQGDGYKPFVSLGTWSVRPENPVTEANPKLEDIALWQIDFEYMYENILDVKDYWIQHRQ